METTRKKKKLVVVRPSAGVAAGGGGTSKCNCGRNHTLMKTYTISRSLASADSYLTREHSPAYGFYEQCTCCVYSVAGTVYRRDRDSVSRNGRWRYFHFYVKDSEGNTVRACEIVPFGSDFRFDKLALRGKQGPCSFFFLLIFLLLVFSSPSTSFSPFY